MPETADFIKNESDERAIANGCEFDERRAERVVAFMRRFLCHSKGKWAGEPFELLDWQREDVIMPLFGWVRPDGTRRFRKTYIEIPKKNGKSTLASAVGLYLLLGDGEMGAEVYSAASDQEQASVVHREAINMVDSSPALSRVAKVNRSNKNIAYEKTKSFYRALSSQPGGKEGLNAHGIIADELHVWHGRAFWDTLKYAFSARRQGLLFVITTAGDDPLSICYEQYRYAKGVLGGDIEDERFFAYVKEASPGDDWRDKDVWFKANPSLGHTLSVDDFQADANEAEKTPSTQTTFKRYRLDIWATSSNPWLKREDWDACTAMIDMAELDGCICYAGLDLSRTRDMTALVLVFPLGENRFRIVPFFWLPEAAVNDPGNPEEFRVWAKAKLIEVTDGNYIDFGFIKKRIVEISKTYNLGGIYYDPKYAADVVQSLMDEHGIHCEPFKQSIMDFTPNERSSFPRDLWKFIS